MPDLHIGGIEIARVVKLENPHNLGQGLFKLDKQMEVVFHQHTGIKGDRSRPLNGSKV